jgi:hypothetical protein
LEKSITPFELTKLVFTIFKMLAIATASPEMIVGVPVVELGEEDWFGVVEVEVEDISVVVAGVEVESDWILRSGVLVASAEADSVAGVVLALSLMLGEEGVVEAVGSVVVASSANAKFGKSIEIKRSIENNFLSILIN